MLKVIFISRKNTFSLHMCCLEALSKISEHWKLFKEEVL